MNVNINNKNLFSQSLLINKFFFQKNSSHKQTGITTVDSGCQYRNNNYYYNKDGVPFLSKEQADRCICLLYTSPSPRDRQKSRMPSSA